MSKSCIDPRITPLTEQEIVTLLQKEVDRNAKQWGEDNYWTNYARRHMNTTLEKWRAGEVVAVMRDSYRQDCGNGLMDFTDVLYSDGTVKTECYGWTD